MEDKNLFENQTEQKENQLEEKDKGIEEQGNVAESVREEKASKPKLKRGDKIFFSVFSVIIALLVTYVLLFSLVFLRIEVSGRSMQPTLNSGDIVIANKLKKIERGDVVVISGVKPNGDWLIKRVIAIEGDEVIIEYGKVFVNGEEVNEPYVLQPEHTFTPDSTNVEDFYKMTYTVGEDQIFYLGDNRMDSLDSRYYGVCSQENVEGVVGEFFISIKETTTKTSNFFIKVKGFFGLSA